MSELLPIMFTGYDDAVDARSQKPGALAVAENCAMDLGPRLVKRAGTTGLSRVLLAGGSVESCSRILSRGTDLAILDGEFCNTYSPDLGKWQQVGRPVDMRITKRGLVDTTRSVCTCNVAVYGNLLVTVFQVGARPSGPLYVKVETVDKGETTLPPLLLAVNGSSPRVRVSGSDAIIVFSTTDGGGAGAIYAKKLSLTSMSVTLTGILEAGSPVEEYAPVDFDIMTPTAGVPTMYVAYSTTVGTDRLKLGSWVVSDFSVATAATTFPTASNTPATMCVAAGSNKVHVAASKFSAGVVRLLTTNATLGAVVQTDNGGTGWFASVSIVDSTNLLLVYTESDAYGTAPFNFSMTTQLVSIASHSQVGASKRITPQVVAHTRPFTIDGRWFTLATVMPKNDSLTSDVVIPNASCVVLEIETTTGTTLTGTRDSPCAHVGTAENLTGWQPGLPGHMIDSVTVDGSVYVPATYRNLEPRNAQDIPIGFNLIKIDVGGEDTHRVAAIGRGALLAGAAPRWFDGASVHPYGFVHAPLILSAAASGAGTGVMAAGVYTYVAVYEWRDANGVLHRSVPSAPVAVTAAALDKVAIEVISSAISQKQGPPYTSSNAYAASPVMVALYRTTVGGSIYYRLTIEPTHQVLLNDPSGSTVTLSYDSKNDANVGDSSTMRPLNTQPQLYTAAGELEDVPPPSLITVLTHRGRIFGIDGTLRTLWATKDQTQDPQVAPGFNEALTLSFAHDKTALAALDEKLVVFGEDSIDVVHGDGPDAGGNNSTWQIQAVQTDVGCVNPRSVTHGPMGVVFESTRGIELLGRDLTITRLHDVPEGFPDCTSAVLVASKNEIRWTYNAADGVTGVVFAWDYLHGIWFTRKYKNSAAIVHTESVAFADAALVDGVYTMATAGAQVYQETTDHKLDAGIDYVRMTVELAWLSPSSKMAWHRIKDVSLLGTSVTEHELEVAIARDYATTFEQTKTFAQQSDATAIGPLEKCRVSLINQKCRAVKLRIRDATPSGLLVGNGDGPILEGVAFRVGTKAGPAKTNSGERG